MVKDGTNYTVMSQERMSSFMERIKTFYCREDFEHKIKEVEQASKDASPSRKRELVGMCTAVSLNFDEVYKKSTRSAELKKVPLRKDLCKNLIKEMHKIYSDFPTADQFMGRLVRRRLKDTGVFENSSTRLAIVQKFVLETDYETKSVIEWVKSQDSFNKEEFKDIKCEKEKIMYLANRVTEDIFDELNDENQEKSFRTFLLKDIGKHSDFVINNDLSTNEIEADYRDHLKASDKKAETRYEDRKDSFNKKNWNLLKFADELEEGHFKNNGKTKEYLYMLAIVFDMTLYIGLDDEIYIPERCLEKNLFFDYYCDNLLRYIWNEEYRDNKGKYESEPSGAGINYKNYVEVIYLYYIYKKPELTPREKLKEIDNLIKKCFKLAKEKSKKGTTNEESGSVSNSSENTALYKNRFIQSIMYIEDEDALVDFIVNEYKVYDNENNQSVKIRVAQDQITATEQYDEIINLIKTEYSDVIDNETNYGISDAIEDFKSNQFSEDETFVKSVLEDKKFRELFEKLYKKLHLNKREEFTDNSVVTRTKMITLYYHLFSGVLEELIEYKLINNLPELYEEFCEGDGFRKGLNHYLKESRYQEINTKNIFDMFVIFSLVLGQLDRF